MPTSGLTPPTIGMLALSGTALVGAAFAVLSDDRGRRNGGLAGVVLAVTGLLLMLGVDLIALVWLAMGSVLAGFPAAVSRPVAPSHPAGAVLTAGAIRPSRKIRLMRLASGLPAILLGGVLLNVVRAIDWPAAPTPPTAGTAEIGGLLMTADLALLLGTGLLLVVVLVSARWMCPRWRRSSDPMPPSTNREGA